MFHLVGKTLTVLATIGAVIKVGEYLNDREENERRRLVDKEARRRQKISEEEYKQQEKIALQAVKKRRELRESEIKRIVYGIPVHLEAPVKKRSWWKFGKTTVEPELNIQDSIYVEDESELKAQEEFRAKNPFIHIKVPSRYSQEFLEEFTWLQMKTGSLPSTEDQKAILIGIIKNR